MSESSEKVKKWRCKTKQRIVEAFGGSCAICGYNKCNASLSLHHLNPLEKDFSFNRLRANPKSWNKIVEELRKCVLLCHNCHNEYHAGVTSIPDDAPRFNETFSKYGKIQEIDVMDHCPICNKLKSELKKHCSQSCANKSKIKFDWDSIDLLEESKTKTNIQIAEELGLSDSIISRKLKILKTNIVG